jgi:hypothetical protein
MWKILPLVLGLSVGSWRAYPPSAEDLVEFREVVKGPQLTNLGLDHVHTEWELLEVATRVVNGREIIYKFSAKDEEVLCAYVYDSVLEKAGPCDTWVEYVISPARARRTRA